MRLQTKLHQTELISIGFVLILAASLRLYRLDANSLWIDEIGQAQVSSGDIFDAIIGSRSHIAAAPLDYIITNFVLHFSKETFFLRLPSVIWGVLTVLLVYILAKKVTKNYVPSLIAAYISALSPAFIEYSQELRFYSLFTFLTLLLTLLFLLAIERGKKVFWIFFFLTSILAFFSHYFTIFVMGGFFLFLAMFIYIPFILKRINGVVEGSFTSFKKSTPFLIYGGIFLAVSGSWLVFSRSSLTSPFHFTLPNNYYLFAMPYLSVHYSNELLGLYIFPALFVIGLITGWKKFHPHLLLFILMMFIAFGGVLLGDKISSYFVSYRQFLFIIPFYSIIIAIGVYSIIEYITKNHRFGNLFLTLFILGGFTILLRPHLEAYYTRPVKEDWRNTASFLAEVIDEDSALVVSPSSYIRYILYYEPELSTRIITPSEEAIQNSKSDFKHLWVLTTETALLSEINQWIGWEDSSVVITLHPSLPLYFLGAGTHEQLILGFSEYEIPPQTIENTSYIYELFKIDSNKAIDLMLSIVNSVDIDQNRLFTNNRAVLKTTIARLYHDAGNLPKALAYLDDPVISKSTSRDALNNAGYIILKQGNCDRALQLLERNARFNPRSYWTFVFLVEAYTCKEDWEGAARTYQKLFSLKETPNFLIAEAQMNLKMNNLKNAERIYSMVAKEYPNTAESAEAEKALNELEKK